MFLSRIYSLLLVTSLTSSSLASAQALRKPISSQDESFMILPTHKTKDSFLSRVLGKISNKSDRQLQASIHYSQMGTDIDGNVGDGFHGKSTAMSKDGSRVAIGAPGENSGKGTAKVFEWDATLEEWVQVGQNIFSTSSSKAALGHSIDSNEDMSRIVVGAPESHNDGGCVQVYELDSATNTWQQVGPDLPVNIAADGHAGVSVTMNAVGDRVAFGSPRLDSYAGQVAAFEYSNGAWNSLGQVIDGEPSIYYDTGSYTGGSIAMDASGNRMVIGGRLGSMGVGKVSVYNYDNVTSQWVPDQAIEGKEYYDRFGGDVDISEDGNRIIVGAFTSDAGGLTDAGEFSVYEYNNTGWTMIGQLITGSEKLDKMGHSVSISGDGTTVAISSPENDDNGNNAGKVEIFKYSESEQAWVSAANEIFGECALDMFGEGEGAIAMDYTGNHLAIGSQRSTYYTGMTRVYEALAGQGSSGSINSCLD